MSRLPGAVGLCKSDLEGVATITNSAERRLMLFRGQSDQGMYGSWARMVFNVQQTQPLITLPRGIARLMDVAMCQQAINVQNEFYEFLEFGHGLQPMRLCNGCSPGQFKQIYARGEFPLFRDLDPNQFLRIIPTDDTDVNQRVLVQGLDANGNEILSEDVLNPVKGVYVSLEFPFVQTPMIISQVTGIQKDNTSGVVQFQQADATTGATVPVGVMQPGELVAGYPRYFVNGVPFNCCHGVGPMMPVQVTALVKLDHVDVVYDQDYYVTHNLEALIAECQAIRYSEMDTTASDAKATAKHKEAIGYLNGELAHYLGTTQPAVDLALWGSAHLSRQRIGSLI